MKKIIFTTQKGFGIMEVLVSVLIIMILTLGVYQLAIYFLNITSDNKFYVEAIEIANQKMEYIRNLPYDSVGTLTGFPAGEIPEYENLHRDGNFLIHTTIIYHDDEYDGTLASGTDLILNDYKIATIEVSWNGKFGAKSVTVFSKIISATEEMDIGAGLLKLIIVDANGDPVPNANIHIENNLLSPAYSQDFISDANGALYRALEPSFEGYEVTVTKAGYGTDQTYPRTINNPNPTKPHLSIISAVKTEESFSIDLLSNLTINTVTSDLPDNWQVNSDASGKAQINSRFDFDAAGFMYVVWQDYCCSADSKIHATWNSDKSDPRITLLEKSGAATTSIVWVDNKNTDLDLFLHFYEQNGNPASTLPVRVNTNAVGDGSAQSEPSIISDNDDNTYIFWTDERNGDKDVYAAKISKSGNFLWSPDNKKINTDPGSANQYSPDTARDSSGYFYIVWTDERNGDKDIYAQKYDTDGNPEWADDLEISHDTDSANQEEPAIAIDATDNIYVVWTDERNGDKDIYAQKYDTDGNNLWTQDLRISLSFTSSNEYNPDVTINPNNNKPFATWQSDKNGDLDIFISEFNFYSTSTPAANVPIIIRGTKKIGELPNIIYEYDREYTIGATGKLNLQLEWDVPGYTITLKTASTSYNLLLHDPTPPVEILPDTNNIINLYLE